jgi:hypothetical protein
MSEKFRWHCEQQANYVKRIKKIFGDVQSVPMFIGTTDEKFFAQYEKKKDLERKNKRDPVRKNMEKFNRPVTHTDRKKEQKKRGDYYE